MLRLKIELLRSNLFHELNSLKFKKYPLFGPRFANPLLKPSSFNNPLKKIERQKETKRVP
jgi:hypothetical protein